MRIVAGKHKRRELMRVMKDTTRETSDMVKVAVFNMLPLTLEGAVLDLFAGSGSYGLEALSRGASHVDFVDIDKDAILVIKKNGDMLKETSHMDVYHMSYETFIKNSPKKKYQFIFLDPPYALNVYENNMLSLIPFMEPSCYIVCESTKKIELPDQISSLEKIKDKTYGIKRITIYRYEQDIKTL